MNLTQRTVFLTVFFSFLLLLASGDVFAQTHSFNYVWRVETGHADEPPNLNGLPELDYPEAARKAGVEGTLKAKMTLGENGKVRDIVILEGLPGGVDEAFRKAVQNLYFQPARQNGQPVATTLFMDFIVTVEYSEGDKNVNKPKITEKPAPVYPEKYRAERLKGTVEVVVMFHRDGTLKVVRGGSVMPKEFDQAAAEAAQKIKFQPAVHKKSKQPVTQTITVVYEFKP
jgi:TonB family protein